jgi:AraC family transcriptional regulator
MSSDHGNPGTSGDVLAKVFAGPFCLMEVVHRRGLTIPMHGHALASLNFVRNGLYREKVLRRASQHRPGSLLLKPPGVEHSNDFEYDAHTILIEMLPSAWSRFDFRADCWQMRSPRLARIGRRLGEELAIDDALTGTAVECLVWELAASFDSSLASRKCSHMPRWVSDLRELLAAQFREPLGLEEVANTIGVHPSHLAKTMRAKFGCTLGEYQRHERVRYVARKLRESETPLALLAADSGFSDQSHMTRSFRAVHGVTPAVFRRKWRS